MNLVGQQTERRRRRAMRVVAAAAIVAVGIVIAVYCARKEASSKVSHPASNLPKGVHQQLSGFEFTRSEGGQRVFTIRASRTLSLNKGRRAILQDVYVEFFGRSGGEHDILRTRQGEYDTVSGNFSSPVEVEIELNAPLGPPTSRRRASVSPKGRGFFPGRQPVILETSDVSYDRRASLLETASPVQFTAGPVSGTAVGMTYATRDGWLQLQRQVEITYRPAAVTRWLTPIHLSAGRFHYDRRTGEGEFWGPVTMTQPGSVVAAGHAQILLDSANRATQALLAGGVDFSDSLPGGKINLRCERLTGWLDPATEQLVALEAAGHTRGEAFNSKASGQIAADEIKLDFSGGKPAQGEAVGNVEVHFAPVAAPLTVQPTRAAAKYGPESRETLRTARLRFSLRPGGKTLRDAATVGPGELIISPQRPTAGIERVSAGQFQFRFDPLNRLEALRGLGGTRVISLPPASSPRQDYSESTAERLTARFLPATESLESADQEGDFHYERGDRQAAASRAHYAADDQTLTLTGRPHAWDPTTRLSGNQIRLEQKSGAVEVLGEVRATYIEPAEGALPSNILADRATATRGDGVIRFQGHVRAWRGADVIEAPALQIFRRERRASAGPSVISSYLAPRTPRDLDPSGARQGGQEAPVTIQADHLDYFDRNRKASYIGHVVMRTQGSVLRADRVDVYFSPAKTLEGSKIVRAVAAGHVEASQPGRRATSDRAVYHARTGEIVMTGGPPTLYDAARGLTTGRRLTFFTGDDRVLVDEGRNFTRPPRPPVAP